MLVILQTISKYTYGGTMTVELIKTVKPVGNTGHITIPKKHIGKQAKVIILSENEGRDKNDCIRKR